MWGSGLLIAPVLEQVCFSVVFHPIYFNVHIVVLLIIKQLNPDSLLNYSKDFLKQLTLQSDGTIFLGCFGIALYNIWRLNRPISRFIGV